MHYLYEIKYCNIVYYGITNDITRRFAEHKNYSSNKLLREYLLKYNVSNFIFRILDTCPNREYIEELEQFVITEAKSLNRLIVCNVINGSLFTGDSSQVGSSHWNAKLTEADIIDIRSIYSQGGITQKEIGEIYGVSNKVISKITTGSRWNLEGSTITKNSTVNKVANRRKLTDTQVVHAREEAYAEYLRSNTVSILALANTYSISRQSMRGLLRGIYYKNLGGPILSIDYFEKYGKYE